MPRDVEPRIEELDGEFLYNIDDLSKVVSETLSTRSREAASAEAIVGREAEGYDRWADAEQATPTIVALRTRLSAALEEELHEACAANSNTYAEPTAPQSGKCWNLQSIAYFTNRPFACVRRRSSAPRTAFRWSSSALPSLSCFRSMRRQKR